MPDLPTCDCISGYSPYDRLTFIYQAAKALSGDATLPDAECVAGLPPFHRFSYIYAALRVLAADDSLPSQECIEGESFQDQVTRIYEAALAYAGDATLPAVGCVRGTPLWSQWVNIYAALYAAAGSPAELVDPTCVSGPFAGLSESFCALLGEAPCVTPTMLSATIDDSILTLTFDVEVTGHSGFFLEIDGGNAAITFLDGEGTTVLTFSSNPAAGEGEEVVLGYDPGNVANGDCPLAEIEGFEVTNNTGVTSLRLTSNGDFRVTSGADNRAIT